MATSSHSTEPGYFPCPAGVNVMDHVTLKLCSTNYFAWTELMRTFLTNQKLLGFIDGTLSPLNKPPSPQTKPCCEEKCSVQDEINAELKRREDWENELQLDSEQMPESLRECLEEWKLEQQRVKEWEAERMVDWKKEHEDREANWKRKWEQSQEWVQNLRKMMKLAIEANMEIDQKEIWQESDQEEERQHEQQRRRWEQLQEKNLEMEQKCREEWKRKWDEKCKENVEAKELGQKLDLEAKDRNKWHRELECGQKENWERRNEWERGEKRRLLNREENCKYTDWKRSDGLVMGWVKATVTEEILVQVIHLKTAREVWIKLEKIFIPPFRVTSRAEQIDWTNQSTGKKVSKYKELHRAILTVKWKNAEKFLKEEPDAVLQPITWSLETALMVAVRSDRQNNFVKELITRTVWESKRKACIKGTGQEIMVGTEQMDPEQKRMEIMLQEIMTGIEGNEWKIMERILQERRNIMERRMKGIESMEEEEQIESREMEQIEQMEVQMKDRIDQEMRNKIRGEMEQERMMIMWEDIRTQSVPLLGETDVSGATALHAAVEGGNMDAVKWLLCKNLQLANIEDTNGTLAVHVAARLGNKEIVEFLLPLTTKLCEKEESGHKLLHFLASGGLCDIASKFLEDKPRLACREPSPLVVMAQKRCSFYNSGTTLSIVHRLINSVSQISCIQETKSANPQALKLVELLCKKVVEHKLPNAANIFKEPLMKAASLGIHEIVEEILWWFPSAIHLRNEMNQSIFHLAIVYRREKVFNLIRQMKVDQRELLSMPDASTNNALHLAGNMAPQQQLLLRANAAGAALQMQRELQWFKEVENFVLPHARDDMNAAGKTPQEVFTEKHQDLVKEGEKWMKDTATSCSIVAALITTIVFAAAITVPGGSYNDSNLPKAYRGLPVRLGHQAFTLFGVFDAIALFSSTTSLLIFLSILTSRYGEQDFLWTLPNRMIVGLVTLFLSILSMMIAFAATLKLVFGERTTWLVIPVGFLSLVPVTIFAFLQYPLLRDMIQSTYGQGIFRKQSYRILY